MKVMKKKERIIRILINNSKRSVFLINKIERIVCVFKNCKKEKMTLSKNFQRSLSFPFFSPIENDEDRCRVAPQKKWLLRICGAQLGREQQDQQSWEDFPSQFLSCLKNFPPKRKTSGAGTWKVGTWMEAERKLPNLPADNSRPP